MSTSENQPVGGDRKYRKKVLGIGTASTKAERRERRWLIPETEVSPAMLEKYLPVFPPELLGQQTARLPPCLLPLLILGPPGAAACSELLRCQG